MAQARFAVRLPPGYQQFLRLEDIRASLRRRLRDSRRFNVVSFPSSPSGSGFEVVVSFSGGERLLWLVATELQDAVDAFLPGATVGRPIADFTERGGPFLAGPPAAEDAETRDRQVNTLIVLGGTEDTAPLGQPLASDADYRILLGIGNDVDASLLSDDDGRFPDRLLPGGGLWLRAVLAQDGAAVTKPFYLPDGGASFACDCLPEEPHAADCSRLPWVRFDLRTPAKPGIVRAELAIYYQATAVHVQQLTLPAGEGMPGGPQARLLGGLTRTFTDLGKLAGRSVSIVTAPGAAHVVVNSTEFANGPFAIPANPADTSARNTRFTLKFSHFGNSEDRTRYAPDHSKAEAEFHADLLRLAEDGSALYHRLFRSWNADVNQGKTLPHLLRHEAEARRRPPVIQVVDGQPGEHAQLWSTVYDIPICKSGNIADYQLCPSLTQFGPGATTDTAVPAACPHGQEHLELGDVLCPFGFWGLSCIIEQAPTLHGNAKTVVLTEDKDLAFVFAPDVTLDGRFTSRHREQLDLSLPDRCVTQPPIGTKAELARALAPEDMDVVYLYCHAGYEQWSEKGAVETFLNLGAYKVRPQDVSTWASTRTWPDPHWPSRHPLVILNGCHTTETVSGMLNSFVPVFTDWASASGVIGTEVKLHQGVAGWAMELMLTALARGATVGSAIREVRWAMLRRGNVMGFAYTPYCLASLTLRPVYEEV